MSDAPSMAPPAPGAGRGGIKCVVWDLDDTVWDGTLAETDAVHLRPDVRDAILELDRRGILQSVASRNEHELAVQKLQALGLDEYLLCPQIGWGAKSAAIGRISSELGIHSSAIAFVDDQPLERYEVSTTFPEVLCLDPSDPRALLSRPELSPLVISSDARQRRLLYRAEQRRKRAEEEFVGTPAEVLASLSMELTLQPAEEDDVVRAEELTLRTHQLNTTGRAYNCDELRAFMRSTDHRLLIVRLEDRFGTYGTVGLVLLEQDRRRWTIKLFITSCRVMSRGVGGAVLSYLAGAAKANGVELWAEFVPNDRNRIMRVTFGFARFVEAGRRGEVSLLRNPLEIVPDIPLYFSFRALDG